MQTGNRNTLRTDEHILGAGQNPPLKIRKERKALAAGQRVKPQKRALSLRLRRVASRTREKGRAAHFRPVGPAKRFPAFWSSGTMCGPATSLRLRDEVVKAKESSDWSMPKEISDAMRRADSTLFPRGDFSEFSKYNIGIEKARMNEAGRAMPSPVSDVAGRAS